jgi:hypothetical protein
MSQKETTDPIGRFENNESPGTNLSKIGELAQRAYEQKRTKDCLDLTRAILLLDPDNAEAQRMRHSIQSEMHRDLDDARAFLLQAQQKEHPEAPLHSNETAIPSRLSVDSDSPVSKPWPLSGSVQPPAVIVKSIRMRGPLWLIGASGLVVVCAMIISLPKLRMNSNSVEASLLTATSDRSSQTAGKNAGESAPEIVDPTDVKVPAAAVSPSTASSIPAAPPVAARVASVTGPRPVPAVSDRPVAVATGTLAVSSPTSIDIYEKDSYLGSAPVSLELSAGTHTLEYRHGSLQKNLTYVINGNETSKAMITFDVSLQINSKPWAEVFVDGADRKDLGQTPLSDVRVPIGSVLVLENPQFQAKKYRVTGNETRIQVVFP